MAHFSKDWLTSTLRRSAPWRAVGVGLAVLAVSLVFAGRADAGVMVASDSAVDSGSATTGAASDLANSPAPAPQRPTPLAQEWHGAPVDGTTGGAGSQTSTGGSSASPIAFVCESPLTAQSSLVSRLALCSRISLPSPLEDRFFRPPRAWLMA